MKEQPSRISIASSWQGPGARAGWEVYFWRTLLWTFIYPVRRQRVHPTLPGLVLVVLSLGVGTAAYNSASNILFITLSLLLSCLVLSGVLSWLNFRGLRWRLQVQPPLRVGMEHVVKVELRNTKRVLPTYGLWFELRAGSAQGSSTIALRERLDPHGEAEMEWQFRPVQRGLQAIELLAVGSAFPFGFLRKSLTANLRHDVVVWPAPVEYRRFPVPAWQRAHFGEVVPRLGHSGDLLALRQYEPGDSHRQIHWKASARLRQLVVRQFAAESQDGFSLWLQTSTDIWTRPEQFELLCSFVATLAEDLFKTGKLYYVTIDDQPFSSIRHLRDLEVFLDDLARATPGGALPPGEESRKPRPGRGISLTRRRNVITFAPDGPRGVAAYVDGQKAASA